MEEENNSLAHIDKALDEYEKGLGLTVSSIDPSCTQYLEYSHKQIEKMTPYECSCAAILLAQLAIHLQRSHGKEVARFNWAEEKSKMVVANVLQTYPGYSFEERKNAAIKDNEHAMKINSIKMYARARADRIGYLAGKVEFLAKTFMSLSEKKRA